MTPGEDLDKVLGELNAHFARMRELFERLQGDEADDAQLDEQLVSVMRALGAKARELRTIAQTMPREDWDGLMAKSRERHPEAAAKLLDWLGLPQAPNVGYWGRVVLLRCRSFHPKSAHEENHNPGYPGECDNRRQEEDQSDSPIGVRSEDGFESDSPHEQAEWEQPDRHCELEPRPRPLPVRIVGHRITALPAVVWSYPERKLRFGTRVFSGLSPTGATVPRSYELAPWRLASAGPATARAHNMSGLLSR
jgi:hypothetical protein